MDNKFSCVVTDSADKTLAKFVADLPLETAFHRTEGQEVKCGFGLQGVCCRLCANGPCRVTPTAPRGVCGADADTIVGRNFLRAVAAGSGCYIHVVENAARNLKKTAEAKGELKGIGALDRLCQMLGIDGADDWERAAKVADAVLCDLYKPLDERMSLVEQMTYAPRYSRWQELGIVPGGAKSEIVAGVVKSSTNLSSDPVDMLLHCLRLGISTGLYGLALTNQLNDILLGEPQIRTASVGMRVINPDYINIMVTGHQHAMFTDLQKLLVSEFATAKAMAVGAKGYKIVGCTCVGQDMQVRGAHCGGFYDGHAGNNFTSEVILATGAIDVVLTEFNCTLPGIEPICDALQIKQICLDTIAKKANAEAVDYAFDNRDAANEKILDDAAEAYKTRRGVIEINLPSDHGNDTTLTGLSEGSLKGFLGGTWQPLIDLIVAGEIKGLAGVVGCSNLTGDGHDVLTAELTKELIKRDILVLSAGCSSGGLENVGLMSPEAADLAGPKLSAICKKLGIPPVLNFGPCLAIGRLEMIAAEIAEAVGVDIPALPLVMSAPQWLEEQALADGAFALALGLPLHLGSPPFVTGSPIAVQVLCKDMIQLTGGQVIINSDAAESAEILDTIINQKRRELKLP